ncbi:hypothetical protein [Haloarcula halophila]|uniref:hypothetical protein n=1 Tax=Haloarcula TaxID=2237 RepID=UPI0023E39A39|nr:hypothetical protein [Halomicroarcula sp. DFY41]
MLSLTGSGMTALAGCIGGSGSSSPDSTATPSPTEVEEIRKIEYNTPTEATLGSDIWLDITLREGHGIRKINLISDGELFDSVRLAEGETKARLSIIGADPFTGNSAGSISPNDTEVILISNKGKTKTPLRYKPEIKFKQVLAPGEHEDLSKYDPHIGILVENPTNKPALLKQVRHRYSGGTRGTDWMETYYPLEQIIPKNSEHLLIDKEFLNVRLCEDLSGETHDERISISMAFAEDLGLKIPVSYNQENKSDGCQTSLAGEAETAPPRTETPTETDQG